MKLMVFLEGFPLKKTLVAVLLPLLLLQEISLRAGTPLHSFKRLVLSEQFSAREPASPISMEMDPGMSSLDPIGMRDPVFGSAMPTLLRPLWISGATPSSFFLLPMISTVTD